MRENRRAVANHRRHVVAEMERVRRAVDVPDEVRVDSPDQVDRLASLGCTNFQGFFYSPALEAKVIDDLVAGRFKLAA